MNNGLVVEYSGLIGQLPSWKEKCFRMVDTSCKQFALGLLRIFAKSCSVGLDALCDHQFRFMYSRSIQMESPFLVLDAYKVTFTIDGEPHGLIVHADHIEKAVNNVIAHIKTIYPECLVIEGYHVTLDILLEKESLEK